MFLFLQTARNAVGDLENPQNQGNNGLDTRWLRWTLSSGLGAFGWGLGYVLAKYSIFVNPLLEQMDTSPEAKAAGNMITTALAGAAAGLAIAQTAIRCRNN